MLTCLLSPSRAKQLLSFMGPNKSWQLILFRHQRSLAKLARSENRLARQKPNRASRSSAQRSKYREIWNKFMPQEFDGLKSDAIFTDCELPPGTTAIVGHRLIGGRQTSMGRPFVRKAASWPLGTKGRQRLTISRL